MTVTETIILKETIGNKAEQITALALVAQTGSIEELTIDKIESLFSLFIDLSTDISNCADQINLSLLKVEIM
jgi:hypothetical protein